MQTLKIAASELNLPVTLACWQTFRWRNISDSFYGVVDGLLVYLKRIDDETIEWRCLGRSVDAVGLDVPERLLKYFQMDISLKRVWADWSAKDLLMDDLSKAEELQGIRILKQEPLEAMISLICSVNNHNVAPAMVSIIAKLYGEPIILDPCEDGKEILALFPDLAHAFPTMTKLFANRNRLEEQLSAHNFGCKAHHIDHVVKYLGRLPSTYLMDLERKQTEEIRRSLMKLPGVPPQLVDCIALMALGQPQCVPITRRLHEVTKKYYIPTLPPAYDAVPYEFVQEIMAFYETRFGTYAGWAVAVLSTSSVESFVHVTPEEIWYYSATRNSVYRSPQTGGVSAGDEGGAETGNGVESIGPGRD
ncbi:8-oxoguanine DNA-glycosylase [Trichostrongylus colubriformis]|uniref:8-oxoguanine DNA-glycosylase n=1 Tax=Trichostrongylus colubriformis TaxID=6319 RepID=A0AAN8FZR1_TRICO